MSECEKGMCNVSNMMRSILFKHLSPMELTCDCLSAIKMVEKDQLSPRSMNIDLDYHAVRESEDEGRIKVKHIPGTENEADVFTKRLCRMKFWGCVQNARGYSIDEFGKFDGWRDHNEETQGNEPGPENIRIGKKKAKRRSIKANKY